MKSISFHVIDLFWSFAFLSFPFFYLKYIYTFLYLNEGHWEVLVGQLFYFVSSVLWIFIFFLFLSKFRLRRPILFNSESLHSVCSFSFNCRLRYIFLFFVTSFIILIAIAFFGVGVQVLFSDPREFYQYGRKGLGVFYAISMTLFAMAVVSGFMRLVSRNIVDNIIFFIFCVLFSLLFGQRMIVVQLFVCFLFFLAAVKARYVRPYILFIFCVFGTVSISHFLSSFSFMSEIIRIHFPHTSLSLDVYEDLNNGVINFFWGQIYLSSFWEFVPRVIVPEKPFEYGKLLLNAVYFPGSAEATHTPAFAPFVWWYADWGWPGVMLSGLSFNSFTISYMLHKMLSRDRVKALSMIMPSLFLVIGPGYMNFFPAFLVFVSIYFIYRVNLSAFRSIHIN